MQKEKLSSLVEDGLSIRQMVILTNISYSNIRYWLNKHKLRTNLSDIVSEVKYVNHGKCQNCNRDMIKTGGRTTKYKYCNLSCQHEFQMNERISSGKASNKTLKLFLIKKYGEKCMDCGWCEINRTSKKVPIELEHIDGNSLNNLLDNLKLLCPNCHSLTSTYKGLNRGNGRHSRRQRYKENKSY